MQHSKNHIDYLNRLFEALPQDSLPMTLSEYDGFVTGLLICPVDIEPSEWLPYVWGEARDDQFPDQCTAEVMIDAVLAHVDAVAADMSMLAQVQPIFGAIGTSEPTMWEPWIDGFMRVAALRPVAWQDFFEQEDEAIQNIMSFLQCLHDIYTGKSRLSHAQIHAIDMTACEVIPSCVAQIGRRSRPDRSWLTAANLPHEPAIAMI